MSGGLPGVPTLDNLWGSMVKSFESSILVTPFISITNLSLARPTEQSSWPGWQLESSRVSHFLGEGPSAGVREGWCGAALCRSGDERRWEPLVEERFPAGDAEGRDLQWKGVRDAFRRTQPVFFEYNKPVFKKYGLSVPSTWPELLSDIKTFNSHNVIPIALGNTDNWEGLMYLEYLTDRIGGPQAFLNVEAGDKGAWSEPAIQRALADIQALVKDKAFNVGYDSVSWTTGAPSALLYSGKAASAVNGRLGREHYLFQ